MSAPVVSGAIANVLTKKTCLLKILKKGFIPAALKKPCRIICRAGDY